MPRMDSIQVIIKDGNAVVWDLVYHLNHGELQQMATRPKSSQEVAGRSIARAIAEFIAHSDEPAVKNQFKEANHG